MALPPERSDNAQRVERIQSASGPGTRGPTLLDVGSGLGVFPARMKERGWRCTALDPDPRAVEHARPRRRRRRRRRTSWPPRASAASTSSTLNKVLEHVAGPGRDAGPLRASSWRPGGPSTSRCPTARRAAADPDGPGREEFFIEHLHAFSPPRSSLLADRAGFVSERIERSARAERQVHAVRLPAMSAELESLSESVDSFEARYIERARESLERAGGPAIAAVSVHREPAPAPGGAVLAGWWCDPATAAPGVYVLPNPWDDRDAIELLERYCWELGGCLAADLGRALNELHGVRRADAYWDSLLMSWLLYAVTAVVDRRLFVVTAAELRPGAPWHAGAELPVPETLLEAVAGYASDDGSASLLTRIAALEGREWIPDSPAASAVAGPPRLSHRASATRPAARMRAVGAALASHLVRVALRAVPGRRLVLTGGARFTASQLLYLGIRAPGLAVRPTLPYMAARSASAQAQAAVDRGALARTVAGGDARATAFAALVPELLPRSLNEGYAETVRRSRKRYGRAAPALIGNYAFDEAENEFVARSREAGRPLAFIQHGGTYLQLRTHAISRLEQRPDSLFLAWGADRGRPGVRTAPDPRLSRLRDSHVGGARVVLVEWVSPPQPHLIALVSSPLANQGYEVERRLADFVGALRLDRRRLALKRFPTEVDAPQRPPALEALATDGPGETAVEWMRRARVAVVSYPDTPFIEAMVIGVPAIGLWDPDLWEMRPDAAPYFDRLAEAGVVHSDPAAAAAKVDEVYERADTWWSGAEIQRARLEFLERFARGPGWRPHWVRILRELRRAP